MMLIDLANVEDPDHSGEWSKQIGNDIQEAEARYRALCPEMNLDKLHG